MRLFLSKCQRIETLSGEIYQRLAIDADYAPEVRATFHKLSNDERSHARDIELLLQATEHELEAEAKISSSEIEAALQTAENMVRILDRVRLSEAEALRLAMEMEEQFVKIHAGNAMHFHNPRVAALFEELGRHDQAHLDTLQKSLDCWHEGLKSKP